MKGMRSQESRANLLALSSALHGLSKLSFSTSTTQQENNSPWYEQNEPPQGYALENCRDYSTETGHIRNSSHTILLVQKTQAASSKTYIECSSVATAMDEVIKMYEEYLKNKYPNKERIEFDVNEVLDMVFNLPDCAALVLDTRSGTYIPHDKSWIQKQVVVRAQSRAR
ncbi:hypothetical protein BGX30_009269 [Mortierella sp. GBA39]|nr:hypothetical protein BGX30_009269 [Mortierella sp. GBA39]